jgi:hypothetical protein
MAVLVVAVLGVHVVALREVSAKVALPVAVVLIAGIVAKHLGLAAVIRRRWRRGRE